MNGEEKIPADATARMLAQVRRFHRLRLQRTYARLNEEDISFAMFFALLILYDSLEGITMSYLSRQLHHSMGGATGIVDRLIAKHYAARHRDQNDRRVVKVLITPAGRGLIDFVQAPIQEAMTSMMGQMEPELRNAWLAAHKKITALLEEEEKRCDAE